MRQTISCFIFFITLSLSSTAQQITKLSGQIIGSKNYYDYSNNSCTNLSTLPNTAFDGNLFNTYATCEVTGGWVGLDLGEPYVITKIAYCPRQTQALRMQLGVFEGANKPDFGDAIPLYLIQAIPAYGTLTSQNINSSQGFRYIRYIGPPNAKCNVAELEFYGYKDIGTKKTTPKITNLPTVIIHTTNAQDIIDKDTYIKGIVSVVTENGDSIYSDSLEIKGRGNVSWDFPKKPYRLKLYNKANLLGLPAKEKNWTLINNYGDKTLMRNLIAFEISKKLELPYTPAGVPVDVFLNGEYKGTYQLCDQIEVATERVVVEKMKTTDILSPEITGGYLIEMDAYANQEISWFTSDRNKVPVTIKYPKDDEIVPAQSNFIKSYFNEMEMAVFASNYTDLNYGFRKYIDLETFLRHFLVGELSGNTDTYWSTYMYKKRNDSKFYFGPVWDFDIAFENDYRTFPINSNPDWVYASKGSSANGVRDIINRIFTDPTVLKQLSDLYAFYRNNGKINQATLLQTIDDYALRIDQSQKLNFTKWNILSTKVHMNPQALGSYNAEVTSLKNFVSNRINWMDNKLNYKPSATFEQTGSTIKLRTKNATLYIDGIDEELRIQVIDLTGIIIHTELTSESCSVKLKPGIYIVKIFSDNGCIFTAKCAVNN